MIMNFKDTLAKVRKDMEEIQGQWDGDESGVAEERAHAAGEVIEAIDSLLANIDALDY